MSVIYKATNRMKGKPSSLRGRKQSKELIEKRISARLKTLKSRKILQGF